MFKDYYSILEIYVYATPKEIKAAFKKQALRWHPDHNIGIDTTAKMQDINEAKLILLDIEARERYNQEYFRFKEYQQHKVDKKENKGNPFENNTQHQKNPYTHEGYDVEDDILKEKMNNAKKQAVDLAKKTIENLRGMTKVGVNAAFDNIGSKMPALLILALICLIIALLVKIK